MQFKKPGIYWRDSMPTVSTTNHDNPFGLGWWDALHAMKLADTEVVASRIVSIKQQPEYDRGYKNYMDKWKEKELTDLLENKHDK